MSEKLGFSRFKDMDACTLEMRKLGHSPEDCAKICNSIHERAEKGALLKAEEHGLQLLTKATEENVVVAGYASWDCVDNEGDIFTVQAQVKALNRFFNSPPENRLITVDHGRGLAGEINIAKPILNFTDSSGQEYFSHVNERGTYLISQLRNDDMKAVQYFRAKAKAGGLTGYSVNSFVLERDPANNHRVFDMEYSAITLTDRLVPRNPKTRDLEVLSKATFEDKTPTLNTLKSVDLSAEEILDKYGFTRCRS